jgi:hypothetical protein
MMIEYRSEKRKRTYTSKPLQERFWAKVKKGERCWIWTGTVNNKGYGLLFITRRPKRVVRTAHRVSYELHKGPIPSCMGVLHRCDTPRCVNPEHFFLGDQKVNMQDAMEKGRMDLSGLKYAKGAFK